MEKKREPDIETESFRAWKLDTAEQSNIQDDIKVKYKDMEIGLVGFTVVTSKKDGKIIFAYKFKHDKHELIYFIPDDLEVKDRKIVEQIKTFLFTEKATVGYNLIDMRESLENIYSQKNILDKIGKEKK